MTNLSPCVGCGAWGVGGLKCNNLFIKESEKSIFWSHLSPMSEYRSSKGMIG